MSDPAMPAESVAGRRNRRAAGPGEQAGEIGAAAAGLIGFGEALDQAARHLVELGLVGRRGLVAQRRQAGEVAGARSAWARWRR